MSPRLILFAGWIAALSLCAPVCGQDAPSLGDVARQSAKDKSNTTPHRVITNDDIPASANNSALGLSGGSSSKDPSKAASAQSAQEAIDKIESKMKALDSMDRATLVNVALQGQNTDFPGRRAWEDKLWDAKQTYVQRGMELVTEAKRILSTAQDLHDLREGKKLKPDDPQVQDFLSRIRQLVQNAVRADAAFQAVVMEGWDLAKQGAPGRGTSAQP